MGYYNEELTSEIISNRSGKIIEFKGVEFGGSESFKRSSYTALEMNFIDCRFHKQLMISEKHFKNGIQFINCEFLDGLSLESITSTDDRQECAIRIISSKSSGEVIIKDCNVRYLNIQLKVDTASLRCLNTEVINRFVLKDIHAQHLVKSEVRSHINRTIRM